ncbi:MAG: hypothetical protein FJX68_19135 [Alphaproteobacteria bacterium]|nr:hypothetical protein [Alphaproteobacteria bacterium]
MVRIKRLLVSLERQLWARRSYKQVLDSLAGLPDLAAAEAVLAGMRPPRGLVPLPLDPPTGKRMLVLAPHPDDEAIGVGGTLAGAIAAGSQVEVAFVTSGRPEECAKREAEGRAACASLGAASRFLRLAEGNIAVDAAALDRLAELLRELAPDIVFCPFPLDDHDDHRRVAEWLGRLAERDGAGGPEVWCYQVYGTVLPNVVVDIAPWVAAKRAAIACHVSQTTKRDWAHFALGLNAWQSRLLGEQPGAGHAEAFFVAPWAEYARLAHLVLARPRQEIYRGKTYRAG